MSAIGIYGAQSKSGIMKKIALLSLVLCLCFLGKSQSNPVKIVVFDSSSTKRIANCEIFVQGYSKSFKTYSNENGISNFKLDTGNYVLSLFASGYDSLITDISVKKQSESLIEIHYHLIQSIASFSDSTHAKVLNKVVVNADSEDGFIVSHESSTISRAPISTAEISRGKSKDKGKAFKRYEKTKTGTRAIGSTAGYSSGVSSSGDGIEFGATTMGLAKMGGPDPGAAAGTLTAGEIHDFSKWELWKDLNENDLKIYSQKWQIKPGTRYTVQVTGTGNKPIIDCDVKLVTKTGQMVWIAKTDQTGKAELWSSFSQINHESTDGYKIEITAKGANTTINKVIPFEKGINYAQINTPCDVPDALDIAFVVDATGSMGDEINYLKAELSDVIGRVQDLHKDLSIRTGSVFYRDSFDSYLTKVGQMSDNLAKTIEFIKEQSADGGGDIEEAVEAALDAALNKLTWRPNARARILFLVLDASPHTLPAVMERIKNQISKAASMGIKIVPITCSGIEKSTEYLMRSMALATNGTYLFLTDHSGIGDSHIAPSTDKYDVELLNGLLLRVFDKFVTAPLCNKPLDEKTIEQPDSVIAWNDNGLVEKLNKDTSASDSASIKAGQENKASDSAKLVKPEFKLAYYPNPTNGIMYVEIKGKLDEFFISDISGKSLLRFDTRDQKKITVDMNGFASGIYLIKYQDDKRWLMKKFVLVY